MPLGIGQRVNSVCVQMLHASTLSVFIFSHQTLNKEYNEQLVYVIWHSFVRMLNTIS